MANSSEPEGPEALIFWRIDAHAPPYEGIKEANDELVESFKKILGNMFRQWNNYEDERKAVYNKKQAMSVLNHNVNNILRVIRSNLPDNPPNVPPVVELLQSSVKDKNLAIQE
ncbi:hypothetical protein SUGI_0656190 [Cryptomeria japonica]|nr:hypothetical protein SUGI_0656190 [Cryptomeria japonica]